MIRADAEQAKPCAPKPAARNRTSRTSPRRGAALLASLALLLSAACAAEDVAVGRGGAAPAKPGIVANQPAHFTETAFVTTDGACLPLRKWLPAGPVKAVILALHGFGDYSHAFAIPAPLWAADGIATYAYDQRGFGGAPSRGLWPGEGQLAADAVAASRILRRTHPGRPVYLLGESMGGAVALLAATGTMRGVVSERDATPTADVDGVILSAPAVWGRAAMDFLPKAALFAGVRLFPDVVLSGRSLHILASDNLAMLRALARDPLMLRGARVDAIYGLVNLMDDALAAAPRLRGPALVLYGAHDEVVPRRAMAAFTARLPREGAGSARLAYYPHGYHLLLRDLDGATVARDVAGWILDGAAPLPSNADAAMTARPWPPEPASAARTTAAMPLASADTRR
jgi:acylglycerol lipase